MSADRYAEFYSLTQSGCQPIESEDVRIEGWIAIYEVEVYQGSPFGPTSRHPHRLTINPEFGIAEVKRLETQFPIPEPQRNCRLKY